MTRPEFNEPFLSMCRALQVKIVQAQADYFFDEFHSADPRDFAHACRELAMGNPGYLPKLDLFREYVASARGMRLEREKALTASRESTFLEWAPEKAISAGDPGDEQYTRLFVDGCVKRIKAGREDLDQAKAFVKEQLKDKGFEAWLKSWKTSGGLTGYTWLWAQLRGELTHSPRTFARGTTRWTKEDLQEVRDRKALNESLKTEKSPKRSHSVTLRSFLFLFFSGQN